MSEPAISISANISEAAAWMSFRNEWQLRGETADEAIVNWENLGSPPEAYNQELPQATELFVVKPEFKNLRDVIPIIGMEAMCISAPQKCGPGLK